MPETHTYAGRDTASRGAPELGDSIDRAEPIDSAVVIDPVDSIDPFDRAARLPHTPPMLNDVNFVTVVEREYRPAGDDAPTHGPRLLAQVRRSWAVSRSRSSS